MTRPQSGVELATFQSRVRRPTAAPPRQLEVELELKSYIPEMITIRWFCGFALKEGKDIVELGESAY